MKLLPLPDGSLKLRLDLDEARLLDQLTGQLIDLLQSHSRTALDPDPLFASLEVGGSQEPPSDPALARLFPDAYETGDDAAQFRSLTEQGLLNRKLQDALEVTNQIGLGHTPTGAGAGFEDGGDSGGDAGGGTGDSGSSEVSTIDAHITAATLSPWVRTLTALRLAIAARIGLERESDHPQLLASAESRGTVLVYDWLGAILDSLLRMMTDSA